MNIPLVDLKTQYQSLKSEIDPVVEQVMASGSFVGGSFVEAFEEEFARACGRRNCVGVANGTDALHLVLRALGIGSGDEVVLPTNTFIATAEAVSLAGAKVVLADVDPATSCLDTNQVRARITPATKAIIPVHLYGRMAPMDQLAALAEKHGLVIVEDAAQAHLANHQGLSVGSLSRAACFSFYPGKNLGAYGDAGAVVTDDPDLAQRIRELGNHGRTSKHNHAVAGLNSRLDGMQAAILSVKLRHLEAWTRARRHAARRYRELLAGIPGLELPVEPDDSRHVYHLFVVGLPQREQVLEGLHRAQIGAGIHYPVPLHMLGAYRHLGYGRGDFPVAEGLALRILSLPIYPEISAAQQGRVAAELGRLLA